MADNYLEYAREDYERRKALWMQKKLHKKTITRKPTTAQRNIPRPDDEAL